MSVLRNVLTYMGLGPDEEYDDGYRYESDDEIDLTADGRTEPAPSRPREGAGRSAAPRDRRRGQSSSPFARRERPSDPHAQRERPDDLVPASRADGPTEGEEPRSEGRSGGRRRISIDDDDPEPVRSRAGRHDAAGAAVRPLRAVPPAEDSETPDDGLTVRPVEAGDPPSPPPPNGPGQGADEEGSASPTGPGLEPPVRAAKPRVLAPASFGDAKVLADEFKSSVPVVMNLQEIERDLARRLIDFASGICYALDGGMEKLATQVFLLIPRSVEVSDEDRRRIEQRGYRP